MPGVRMFVHGSASAPPLVEQPEPAREAVPAPAVDLASDSAKDEPQGQIVTRPGKKVK